MITSNYDKYLLIGSSKFKFLLFVIVFPPNPLTLNPDRLMVDDWLGM